VIAAAQMLSCGLLIHLTGGRIETHFQYFGALAFLAFYRDWRVLATASVVAATDHFIRGYFWPESIFGVLFASPWRPLEHTGWIVFEDIFLVLLIRQTLAEMRGVAERQAKLVTVNEVIERKVNERTIALKNEIAERERAEETRKRLEERLFQSQKLETVGKLAGGVAHEFNSILTAIIGQAEALEGELQGESPLRKNVYEIRHAADRAATLTRQLLAYGRKQILQPRTLDLNQVLNEVLSTVRHVVGRNVDVQLVAAPDLKPVRIDPGQIEQVLINISMNAAEVMPNGGRFTIETGNVILDEDYVRPLVGLAAGNYVRLAISDTGLGMSEEEKAGAFEPFFATREANGSVGLGLATCYGIIKQSGGHMSVYSELARGTTFKIYLPASDQAKTKALMRTRASGLMRGNETILLAEDDPSLLEMAAGLLRSLGYTVLTAANGIDALNLKRQGNIGHVDLLLTDVVMPHMNGRELSDRIRSIYPHTKILFTSAYTENAIVHQGVLDEGVVLLQKPFTPSALARKVREVLDQPDAAEK
jgi:signal transduction histidine kinase/CheY-like chemotaxis protein